MLRYSGAGLLLLLLLTTIVIITIWASQKDPGGDASVLLQFVKGDIQSMDLLSYILEAEMIDTVMHFAAQVMQVYRGRAAEG